MSESNLSRRTVLATAVALTATAASAQNTPHELVEKHLNIIDRAFIDAISKQKQPVV